MDFLNLAKRRYSVRSYLPQAVEPEKITRILEAAHAAPTAANRQPVRLLVLQNRESLEKLEKAADLYHAPLAILVCADRSRAWVRPFDRKQSGDIDAAILADHMMLQATELGLGSVWICYFKPDIIRREFALPEGLEPINILALGYASGTAPSPDRHTSERIPMDQLVSWEHL